MNTTISIIIPIYNQEKRLARCLDSLIEQTYSNIEILCVNDASTDSSGIILETYKRRDARIKVFTHDVNKNAGGARNTAINNASGEYLYFLDSDDWVDSTAIEDLVIASNNFAIDIVVAPITIHNNSDSAYIENYPNKNFNKEELIKYSFLEGIRMLGGMFRRELFIKRNISYPEGIFFEDNAIHMLLFLYADSIKIIDVSKYHMDITNQNSSSRKVDMKHILDRINSTDMFLSNIVKHGFYNSYEHLVNYRYISLSAYTYYLIVDSLPLIRAFVEIYKLKNKVDLLFSPNHIRLMSSFELQTLRNPYVYLIKIHCKHVRNVIHNIRHKIVVFVKKCIGMNPNRSIFS